MGSRTVSRAVSLFLDPPSEHFLGDRLFRRSVAAYGGDDILSPYRAVRDHFARLGIPVHTADRLRIEPAERNLYVSFGLQARARKLAKRADTVLCAYFAMECPIVEPTLYRGLPEMARHFRRIYTWTHPGRLLPFTGAPIRTRRFFWPQSRDSVNERLWRRRDRAFLVMINANKLPRIYDRELYTERVRAVEFFHRYGEIDLYGPHWDRSPRRVGKTLMPGSLRRITQSLQDFRYRRHRPPVYAAAAAAHRGLAESKSETLSRYDFALCFENMVLKGWITEKLFDCLFAGTIPVYWGAPDIRKWVPKECFIDMRDFDGYAELRKYLQALDATDRERFREAGRHYLASAAFDRFRTRTFVARLDRIVRQDLDASGMPTPAA